jgi:hypothetical protein
MPWNYIVAIIKQKAKRNEELKKQMERERKKNDNKTKKDIYKRSKKK